MVNLENIFGLFSHDDEDLSGGVKVTYDDLKKSPMYYVGMYKKLILNHINFNKKVLTFFSKSNQEFDINDIKEAGEYVTYNRAYGFIKGLDLKEETHLTALEFYSDEYLSTALNLGISYFTETEEYERCAFLLKILKVVKKFESKVGDDIL
tara:strand:+ start:38 stop:490 length:453 start_codon:yes stop_codon:yes gene_type:complete